MKRLKEYINNICESDTSNLEVNGFCILKPGFLEHENNWYNMLENNGWQIIQKRKCKLSKQLAEKLYSMHKSKPFYFDLINYMSSDDCICCMCHKKCENPIEDMKKIKDKCRSAWGEDEMKNAMHSSDSLENVNREINICFNNL